MNQNIYEQFELVLRKYFVALQRKDLRPRNCTGGLGSKKIKAVKYVDKVVADTAY